MIRKTLIFLVVGLYLVSSRAETGWAQNSNTLDIPASDDAADVKNRRPLPGEEVTTQSGKKMKVWSTEGPVPVSQAPEPFEDREKTVIPNMGVVVDADVNRKRVKSPASPDQSK